MTFKDIIFTILVIAVFGCLIYLVWYVNTESFKCMASPLTYGVSNIVYKSNSGLQLSEVTCRCEAPGADSYYLVSKNNITFYPYITKTAGNNLYGDAAYFDLSSYMVK